MEMARLSTGEMLSGNDIDANANRERTRQKRLKKWLVILGFVLAFLLLFLITLLLNVISQRVVRRFREVYE